MKKSLFINKAKELINYNTVYMWGTFGAPLTNALINEKKNDYPNWYSSNKISLFESLLNQNYYGFDCIGIIKGILWGWNGNNNSSYGGAIYESNSIPDISADSMIEKSESSSYFSNIISGECVWLPGHIGIYIGDGRVIECSPSWGNSVQTTCLGNITDIQGLHSRVWKKHGKMPYIDYTQEKIYRSWDWIIRNTMSDPETWISRVDTSIRKITEINLPQFNLYMYFKTLIERIYNDLPYTGDLPWEEIVKRTSIDRGNDWLTILNAFIKMAEAEGEIYCEIFKFLPQFILKIYNQKKVIL
jgi:hypothetical protein